MCVPVRAVRCGDDRVALTAAEDALVGHAVEGDREAEGDAIGAADAVEDEVALPRGDRAVRDERDEDVAEPLDGEAVPVGRDRDIDDRVALRRRKDASVDQLAEDVAEGVDRALVRAFLVGPARLLFEISLLVRFSEMRGLPCGAESASRAIRGRGAGGNTRSCSFPATAHGRAGA